MANITDTQRTKRTIIGCIIAIAAAYILLAAFTHQVAGNFHNAIYVIGVVFLAAFFIGFSIWGIKIAENEDGSYSRVRIIVVTVIIIIWAGGWVAGSNEKVAPGLPQMENVR